MDTECRLTFEECWLGAERGRAPSNYVLTEFASERSVFVVDTIPAIDVLNPIARPRIVKQRNERISVYSIRSCPCSSLKNRRSKERMLASILALPIKEYHK